MKKSLLLFSLLLCVLLFSLACKKKETCKQCGWYDKTTNAQIGDLQQLCGDAITNFEGKEESYTPTNTTSTTTVKNIFTKVSKCQ